MRHLSWHGERSADATFQELAEFCRARGIDEDNYGRGAALNAFEAKIAALLGKEAAVFMPSGVMAQQIALRIAADQMNCPNVALHPSNHVEVNEQRAYAHLHGLRVIPIGGKNSALVADDLKKCAERLGTLLIELPLRRIGGILPSWEELQALLALGRERGIRLHLDGARLWESQVFYDRPFDEICRGFDSVYVSFYKGLGGLAGAMLAGSSAMIAEARIWLRRHGGNLITLLPYYASAQLGFEKRLPRMRAYRDGAVSIAAALSKVDGVLLKPAVPQISSFQVFMNRPLEWLQKSHERMMAEDGMKILTTLLPSDLPGWTYTEIMVADPGLEWKPEEVAAAYRRLLIG